MSDKKITFEPWKPSVLVLGVVDPAKAGVLPAYFIDERKAYMHLTRLRANYFAYQEHKEAIGNLIKIVNVVTSAIRRATAAE